MRRLCGQCGRKLTPTSRRRLCGPCLRQNHEDAVVSERPTPEEIAEMTAEIRAKWSHSERLRRAGAVRAKLLRFPDALFGRGMGRR